MYDNKPKTGWWKIVMLVLAVIVVIAMLVGIVFAGSAANQLKRIANAEEYQAELIRDGAGNGANAGGGYNINLGDILDLFGIGGSGSSGNNDNYFDYYIDDNYDVPAENKPGNNNSNSNENKQNENTDSAGSIDITEDLGGFGDMISGFFEDLFGGSQSQDQSF